MQADLDYCLDLIGCVEAGFANNPKDPGGPTNHGITQRTLAGWRGAPVTIADVEALTVEEAREIITAQYATPIRFDALAAGVDYAMLDCSVNSGPDRAVKLLQQSLGMTGDDVDGVLGIHTKAVLDGINDTDGLIVTYCALRLEFMQKLRTWSEFGRGWTNRVNRVQAAASELTLRPLGPRPARKIILDPAERAKASGPTKILSINSGKAAVATAASVAGIAGTAATQASGVLAPYAALTAVRYVLIALACISAAGTLGVAFTRARAGAVT